MRLGGRDKNFIRGFNTVRQVKMMRTPAIRAALLAATVLGGSGLATPALAQEQIAAAETEEGNDIIVTATRRSLSLQDVPMNITAVSADTLASQRLDDVRDLANFTPGVTVLDTGPRGSGTIVLRGLSADDVSDTGNNVDNAVGTYLGEVPLYLDFKLIDVERSEILLGPQGTLYGLGTLAGAIRYIPARPDPDKVEGYAHGRIYDVAHAKKVGWNVDGAFNIPIVPGKVAWRSTAGIYYDPGFIDYNYLIRDPGTSIAQPGGGASIPGTSLPDPANMPSLGTPEQRAANLTARNDQNFEETITTRQQLGLFPTEGITAYLTYVFQQTKTNGRQSNSAGVLGTGKYQNASRYIEPSNRKAHLFALEVEAELGDFAQLVSATAYTRRTVRSHVDVTDLLLDLDYDYELFPAFSGFTNSSNVQKQFNQEIRLVSTHGGPFSWVIGGFFNRQKTNADYEEIVPGLAYEYFGPGIINENYPREIEYASFTDTKVTEKAIFGEGTFEITDAWQVTAGGRYFKYKNDILGGISLPLLSNPPVLDFGTPGGGSASQDGFIYKLNTSYKFNDGLMVYATWSKGYRIGGPNRVAPCPADLSDVQNACALPDELFYGPDKTINKEIGVRASLFDRKLTFNLSAYHIDWKGLQLGSVTTYGATGITVNGGKAVSKGIEFNFDARPIPQLTISGTYSYNDAKLTEDVPGLLSYRNNMFPGVDADGNPCGVFDGCVDKFIDVDARDGDRLPGSTKNSGTLGATWTQPVGDASIIGNWTAVYRGGVLTRPGARAFGERLPGFVTHRASITYSTDSFDVRIYAENLFDKYAVTSVYQDASRQIVNSGVASRYYGYGVISPRKVGVETTFRF